jgi:hypothetical protein
MRLAIASSAATALALAIVSTAHAATIAAVATTNPYSGPTPYYDFDTAASTPIYTGGGVVSNDSGTHAAPFGNNDTMFYSVGPSTSTTGTIDLSNFATLSKIRFLWGSTDTYNDLDLLDRAGNVIGHWTGADVASPAAGEQQNGLNNRVATITLDAAERANIGGLRLSSGQNAFEIDNLSFNGVPEPATWALMILGIGAIGGMMRRRQRQSVSYNFA